MVKTTLIPPSRSPEPRPQHLTLALVGRGNYNARNMLDKTKKSKIIAKFRTHAGDTGSPEVQVAILSAEIDELIEHLKLHRKDHSSRRGLLRKVGERRRLLRFLQRENAQSFEKLVKALNLKAAKQFADLDKADEVVDDIVEEA